MSFASFSGQMVNGCNLAVPYYGCWRADITSPSVNPMTGTASLIIGDLELKGTVVSAAVFAGLQMAQLVGGFGGWRRSVSSQSYYNSSGLKKSLILRDAASYVGENVSVSTDTNIGNSYVREAGPASRLLRMLAGPNWYIKPDGVTRVSDRESEHITTPFQILKRNGSNKSLQVATETYKNWLPGNTFSNALVPDVQTISLVTFQLDNSGKLRLDVLAA